MKTIINLLIASSILIMMNDCEVNAGKTALDYSNSIYAAFGFVFFGFFRLYYREFIQFLTKPQ